MDEAMIRERCKALDESGGSVDLSDVQGSVSPGRLHALSEQAKHKWTREKPTVAGWWWWRANRTTVAQIVKVLDDFTAYSMAGCNDHVDEIGGEWQGPLTPGEE